jgi:hypothetical protein
VIGTTSEVGFLESVGMCDVFSVTYHVPKLKKDDAKKVRNTMLAFVSQAVEMLHTVAVARYGCSVAVILHNTIMMFFGFLCTCGDHSVVQKFVPWIR